jgi:hypothetical protein
MGARRAGVHHHSPAAPTYVSSLSYTCCVTVVFGGVLCAHSIGLSAGPDGPQRPSGSSAPDGRVPQEQVCSLLPSPAHVHVHVHVNVHVHVAV